MSRSPAGRPRCQPSSRGVPVSGPGGSVDHHGRPVDLLEAKQQFRPLRVALRQLAREKPERGCHDREKEGGAHPAHDVTRDAEPG